MLGRHYNALCVCRGLFTFSQSLSFIVSIHENCVAKNSILQSALYVSSCYVKYYIRPDNFSVIIHTSLQLQVFSHERLKSILNGLTIHLVEASPALSSIQQQTLTESPASTPPPNDAPPSSPYQSCRLEAHGGVEVHWYKKLEDVPRGELSQLLKLSEIIPQVFHIFLPTSFWMLCPFISFRYGMLH